jgi:hypothetical protein
MGELNEVHYEPDILERYSGVMKTGSKKSFLHYRTYDWTNENYYVELKSRNNDYRIYPTTMIGYNKVQEWERDKTDRRYFFLFGFLDGFYEWELTQASFDAIGGSFISLYKTLHNHSAANEQVSRSKPKVRYSFNS